MAALALLCYTEFSGKTISKTNNPKENFDLFFNKLGSEYEKFGKNHKVYDIFRCGLAHEYFVKKSCAIAMLKSKRSTCGIGVNSAEKYFFIVEKYFEDFKKAFNLLESQFSRTEANENLAQKFATSTSVQRY